MVMGIIMLAIAETSGTNPVPAESTNAVPVELVEPGKTGARPPVNKPTIRIVLTDIHKGVHLFHKHRQLAAKPQSKLTSFRYIGFQNYSLNR